MFSLKSTLFKILFKNIELKLISLVIGTVMWLMVAGKDYRYRDFNVPIEFKGLAEGLIIANADNIETKDATLRIRASEAIIKTLDERSMFLRVDLQSLDEGDHVIQLKENMVMGRPGGTEITGIFPRSLALDIQKMILKPFVVVNPEILGKPAANYDITEIACSPPNVSLRGPENLVGTIDKIITPPVNVDGFAKIHIQRTLNLVPPHPSIAIIPENITLRIRIEEKRITRSFEKIPLKMTGTGHTIRINPKTLDVWVRGPISQIERLEKENLSAFIALSGNEPQFQNLRLDPQLEFLPPDSFPDVRLERFSQNFVDVFLSGQEKNL